MTTTIPTPYEDLLGHVLENGEHVADRTGTGTSKVFGAQLRYDLREGFPLLTTKKVYTRGVFAEVLWFLDGDTKVKTLQDQNVNIWNEWERPDGTIGRGYSAQWRSFPKPDGGSVDQITQLVDGIKASPFSRRHLVTAWNPGEIEDMALPPCHALFQFNVGPDEDGDPAWLDCQLYQRSADLFLGVPFNIASYAALTEMVAAQTGLAARHFVWTGGDCHIYDNHREQVTEQLSREPRPYPTLVLEDAPSIFDYELTDLHVVGYDPHPAIKAAVSV
ncbi:thymidylate synthase [Kocuria dechangensis]|uniref:Thymidylate synthase n=1 Tax=Kocuria dechangensis TaxID=1176249 RepID=A0A917M0A3_9MICC|nr:thymidylate synthase [Kocuria dechangensis]GGG68172.1 thymidylate synthase [Kocuria dechangensis]